jgi:microcystin-dependent protein
MDYLMAMIAAFAGTFAPKNWALCSGQLMSISQNTALFSLLGTNYGGDGQTTFSLPDLRGRTMIGTGTLNGSGNSYFVGQKDGVESVILTVANLPFHNHPVDANLIVSPQATTAAATSGVPGPTLVPASLPIIGGGPSATATKGYGVANASTTLAASTVAGSVGFAGGSQGFDIKNPYLAVTYIICTAGVFPSRN